MKAWRVISLSLWSIALTLLLLVSGFYYLLSTTLLNESRTTQALRQTAFYDTVRTQLLLPKVQEQFTAGEAEGAVLPQQDVSAEVANIFTQDKIQQITAEVLKGAYQWSDNKSPQIEFSIPFTAEKEALTKSLEARIKQNVAALPRCGANDETPDDLATATCLPLYISRDTVSAAAIDAMNNRLQKVSDTLTPETLSLTNKDLGSAVNVPDYIGYMWAVNLITLPLAIIIALYLLLKRRGAGLIAIGSSTLAVGIIAVGAYVGLHSAAFTTGNTLLNETIKAGKLLIEPALLLASAVGIGAGIVAIVGGIFWQRGRRK